MPNEPNVQKTLKTKVARTKTKQLEMPWLDPEHRAKYEKGNNTMHFGDKPAQKKNKSTTPPPKKTGWWAGGRKKYCQPNA